MAIKLEKREYVLYKVFLEDMFKYADIDMLAVGSCVTRVQEYKRYKEPCWTLCDRLNRQMERETASEEYPYGYGLWKYCDADTFDRWDDYFTSKIKFEEATNDNN